ncbi:MAG: galactosyldiacylglycerol synthase [Methylobacterium sp.]|nr:galactosyldiacylglycerol synthase [Methylobacterium sp.]
MIILKEKGSGKWLGSITETQLQFLIDQLEEEHANDQDYWINLAMLDIFRENNADTALIEILEQAMDGREDIEFVWSRS